MSPGCGRGVHGIIRGEASEREVKGTLVIEIPAAAVDEKWKVAGASTDQPALHEPCGTGLRHRPQDSWTQQLSRMISTSCIGLIQTCIAKVV